MNKYAFIQRFSVQVSIWVLILVCGGSIQFLTFAQNPDPYVGTFKAEQADILLNITQRNNRYEGVFVAEGKRYNCVANRVVAGVSGTYSDNGQDIEFSLGKLLGEYFITTQGVTIPMKRTSVTPSFSNAPSTSPSTAAAQPAQPQVTTPTAARASGKMYTSASGYSFNSPAGWNLQGQENGGYSFLRSGQQTVLSVSPHAYPTIQAILNDIYDQNDAASNTYLKVRKERYGSNGVLATYDGTMQGTPAVLTILSLLSPYGGGVTFTTIAPRSEHTTELPQTLKSMAASAAFSKPQTSPAAEQWRNRLNGKQLLYFYTASGYSEKQTFDLCSNGTFISGGDTSASSSGGFGGDFSAVTQGGGSGTWRVGAEGNQVILIFNYRNGNTARFSVATAPNGTSVLLNNKKYFVQASPSCR
ncbi:hypothetical protein DR864_07245 [Runella rosea]|uniref:Uncharacterized protein n=1 Tax=Runella rosea TaxID=2259595 RepID=A0A344TFX0_9BACT|nr:hypothetical protein [Runella rosea]AXE17541.1 hypothetical protein DR864_07245 [Runella rosea]